MDRQPDGAGKPIARFFIGAALVALFFAWRRIYRPAQACKLRGLRDSSASFTRQAHFLIVAALVLVAPGFPSRHAIFLLITGVHHEIRLPPRPRCRCCPVYCHLDRHAVRGRA